MKRLVIGILAGMLAAGAQTKDEAERLLKAARNVELVDGNLAAAIRQYDAIIAKYRKTDRAVTATALVRKAECLQKQGDTEARKIYEQVVKDYADQKDAVALAKARLGGSQAGQQAMRAVWTGPTVDITESSLSPDGRYILFPDWDTGNLGLHDLVTGADRPLTNTGTFRRGETAFAEVSAFARDGKQVAYAWYDEKLGRYELRVITVNGDTKPRRVFESATAHYIEPSDWSPDGKWIAAYLWDTRNKLSRIGLIGAQDGSLRVLKSGTADLRPGGFSSDGRYLVCGSGRPAGRRDANPRVYILSVDGKSEVPLLSGASSAEYPVWTPDGSQIVFVSDLGGSLGLWSIRVADGKPQGQPERLRADFGDARPLSFARDGSLYYGVSLDRSDVYLAGLNPATGELTSEPRRVNRRSIGSSAGRIAWLPDGKSLSFVNNRNGKNVLVVHTLATGEERDVPGIEGYPGWFADGSIMSRQNKGQTVTFSRVDTRTGEARATWTVPALPSGASGAGFSRDLMTWYFLKQDDAVPCNAGKCARVILARDLETGQDREIFRINATILSGLSISHDGREMAFTVSNGLGLSVMVAPTAGGPPREIHRAADGVSFTAVAWTPDGGHVLVYRNLSERGEVWSLPVKGGAPTKSPLRMRTSMSNPVVSPDGTQIAFIGRDYKAELWAMTGLLQEAKPVPAR